MPSTLGVDIGGTYTKFFDGKSYWKRETPKSFEGILKLLGEYTGNFDTVGVAVAGLIDTERGVITKSPNLAFLNGLPFRDLAAKELKKRVYLINDANAAALGEFKRGAGRGSKIFLLLTLGTGLGGGAVIDGKLLNGFSGCAMEVGHITVEVNGWPCHCGRKGCREAYVSSYGLERFYKLLSDRCLSSGEILKLAKSGDRKALEAVGHIPHTTSGI